MGTANHIAAHFEFQRPPRGNMATFRAFIKIHLMLDSYEPWDWFLRAGEDKRRIQPGTPIKCRVQGDRAGGKEYGNSSCCGSRNNSGAY